MQVFESCHSTWVFDGDHQRFRRILKGADGGLRPVVTGWRPYYGLDVQPLGESFTVLLNPEGTRLLRSWRHTADCTQCGGHVTAVISLDALTAAIGA